MKHNSYTIKNKLHYIYFILSKIYAYIIMKDYNYKKISQERLKVKHCSIVG